VTSHTGTSTPIEFAGAYADAETGLLYLQARYYDPVTSLFLTVDPLLEQTLQAYLYAANNPINNVDPLGLFDWGLALGIAGVVVGVAALSVLTFGAADVVIAGGLTVGMTLDGVATGIGAAATVYDCGKKLISLSCGLDAVSLGLGGGGFAGDFLDLAKPAARTLSAGSLAAASGSLWLTTQEEGEEEDEEGGDWGGSFGGGGPYKGSNSSSGYRSSGHLNAYC
jgi:RHS repeat-associated protein